MHDKMNNTPSSLKTLVDAKKKRRSTRTAFKLLPKVSQLLDWMLESTELPVNALVRTTLESDEDLSDFDYILVNAMIVLKPSLDLDSSQLEAVKSYYADRLDWLKYLDISMDVAEEDIGTKPQLPLKLRTAVLSRVQAKISKTGVRRSVALDHDLVQNIENIALKWLTSRDACVNLLITSWASDWCGELELNTEESELREKYVQKTEGILITEPDYETLKTSLDISDKTFWEHVQNAWAGAEGLFYDMLSEYTLSVGHIESYRNYIRKYDEIISREL
ncbi:MAG: hypothetical protein P9X24_04405 [Candidatus Hatepunaea meridiana]|nr:hypothetical protein [Candidatus Hatepunaea meridiana]